MRRGLVWDTPSHDWRRSRQNTWAWAGRNHWELLAVAFLTVAAAFLRVYRLEEIPAGFHGDEALTGIEGLRILQEGWIGPYTSSALGQLTGPFYLTALLIWLLDASVFSVRLVDGSIWHCYNTSGLLPIEDGFWAFGLHYSGHRYLR